jgi:thioesterase domain-containing protein
MRATLIRVDKGPLERLGSDLFGQLDVHVVGGDHITMLNLEHAPEVAAVLRSIIDAAG